MTYLDNVIVGFDVWLNEWTGGLPGETISARVHRVAAAHPHLVWWKQPGVTFAYLLDWALNGIWPGHGLAAEEHDLERAEAVVQTEDAALPKADQ